VLECVGCIEGFAAKNTYPKFKSQDIRIEHQQEYPDVIEVRFVNPDGSTLFA